MMAAMQEPVEKEERKKKRKQQTLPPALSPLPKSVTHGCFRSTRPPQSRGLLCRPWVIATPALIGPDTTARDALLAPTLKSRGLDPRFGLLESRGECAGFRVVEKEVPISRMPRRSCTAELIAALAVPVRGSAAPKLRSYVHGRNLVPTLAHIHIHMHRWGCYLAGKWRHSRLDRTAVQNAIFN